jgi:hypothetical protein
MPPFFIFLFSCQLLLGEQRALFPPQSMGDWKTTGTAEWSYQNGILSGGQQGDPKRSGLLISKDQFQDFELSLDFKIDEHGKYNSGIYLRYHPEQKSHRLQVNIGRGVAEEPVGLYLDDWLDQGDAKDQYRKAHEWNSMRIRAVGAQIQVWLNGHKIVDYQDSKKLAGHLKAGHLAFQTYGAQNHAGWVKFRKIVLKEISPPQEEE